MTRAPRRLRRLGVAVTALVALTLAACDPPPGEDAFYTPPTSLPSQPGSLIRSRPSIFTLDPVNRTQAAGITSWQVLYRSTNATGGANAVSGTVLVPEARWTGLGQRPLVVYAPGTRGVGDDCAPSYTLAHGADYEMLFIKALLDQGWAVTITDYEGLGTPGQHTYVVGQSEGRAMIDAARAVAPPRRHRAVVDDPGRLLRLLPGRRRRRVGRAARVDLRVGAERAGDGRRRHPG